MKKLGAIVGTMLVLVLQQQSLAGLGESMGVSPFRNYQTLETEHFRITHAQELGELATLAAMNLEDAHRVLTPVMRWTPAHKTQVVLVDNSDLANGLAGAVQRLGMILWTTPPDNWMSITHHDDWFRLLCFHEYAHILNMDVSRDFYRPLRWIIGDTVLPNALWKSWMLEGLAATQETHFTRAGRGRSSFYSMLRRGAWRAGMLVPESEGGAALGQIEGPRTIHPGGEVAYFFGNQLMNAFSAGDPARLGDLSYESGASVPYAVDRNLKAVAGADWSHYWDLWSRKASERAEQETKAVEAAGRTDTRLLTDGNYMSFRPAFSPDGRFVAYSRERYDRHQHLVLRDLQEKDPAKAERELDETIGGGTVAFTSSGDALIYSSVERVGIYDLYSRLRVLELATGRIYDLEFPAGMEPMRAKDPDVRGDSIVFSVSTPGKVGIARAKLIKDPGRGGRYALESVQVLHTPELLGRDATPRLSPDGKRVVFSSHHNGDREERLVLLEPAAGGGVSARYLSLFSGAIDRFPVWEDDQSIVFSSNRTGIDNLYRIRLSAAEKNNVPKAVPITNVDSGLWFAAVSPITGDGARILAALYTPTGFELAWVPEPGKGAANPPVVDTEPLFTGKSIPESQLSTPAQKPEGSVSDYSVFPSILPRAWLPSAVSSVSGGVTLSAMVSGYDALDIHNYTLIGGYDTGLGTPEGTVQYSNRVLGAVLTAAGESSTQGVTETSYERKETAVLGISLYRPFTESVLNPSVAWGWQRIRRHSRSGGAVQSLLADSPQLQARVDYREVDASRQAVGIEEGWMGTLGHQWIFEEPRTTHELLWSQNHFLPLGGHKVLSPRLQFALSDGSSVQVEGRRNQLAESFPRTNFDQLVLRGYPLMVYADLKSAAVASLDFRAPIKRVERGWSTYPVLLNTIYGTGFAESSWLAEPGQSVQQLGSFGAGLRADWQLIKVLSLTTALEYHQGLATDMGGKSELFFEFRLGGFSF